MAETQIVPSNKIRGYVPRLYTIRHVGRVAISEGLGSNGKQAMHGYAGMDMLGVLCIQRVNKILYYSITVLQCVLSCAVTTPTGAL